MELEETDEWSLSFTLDETTPRACFTMVMDEAVANLHTDCAVNIYDSADHPVRQTAFDGTEVEVGVSLPAGQKSATYTLEVVGAFAIAQDMKEWGFEVEENYFFASPIAGKVKSSARGPLRLYCGVPGELSVSFGDEWPAAPKGMGYFGLVRFSDAATSDRRPGDQGGRLVLEVPIEVKP